MINSRLRKPGLRAGSALASLVLAGALASPALAQTTEANNDEVIIVTGSRIASPTITAVSPVQVIGADQIAESGATNIQDVLLQNPAFGTPGLSRTNSAFLTSGTGTATVDLRDLGSDRTLVLINGRRVVAGVPGSSAVDLNVIPTQFIQRVDILTGGASSLYGSDAVAGVVNFVLKNDFQGIDAGAQYNITERGDTPEYQANLTMGGNFSDGRGNMMVHLGYSNQGGLLSRDRKNTAVDDLDTFWNLTGDPADYGVAAEPFYSSFPPQGRFTVGNNYRAAGDYTFTYSPTGQLQPCSTTNGPTCTSQVLNSSGAVVVPGIGTGVGPNGFNRQNFRTLSVPVERFIFATQGHYDISDSVTAFMEGTYVNTSASREIEPFALDSGGSTGIFPANGRAPIETYVPVAGAPGTSTIVANPFVPAQIYSLATDTDGDGLKDIAFAKRLLDFGTRNGSTTREFYRFVVGLEGELFGDFHWDASYNYGTTKEAQTSNGQVNVLNFRSALSAIPGANGPVCSDANARAQGCVPINIYGFNSVSAAAVKYIAAEQTLQSTITQQVLQGNVTGSLFDLPAGPLGVALGVEYRKESSSENNDALTNAGLNAGNALPDTSGKFDVKEVYGEISVPLLSDTPFFYSLELRGAGRISDYSTVGTVYSYSGGVDWSPIADLRFSGTYARSVRAPNVGELFQGPAQTFPTGLVDPCVGITTATATTAAQVCRSQPGVNANIAQNGGVFTLNQADIQGISGFDSGNPNLSEEKSTSYTASAILTPRSINFLRSAVLRVDYYNIKVDDAIVNVPRTFILTQCYQNNDPAYCQFVLRRANNAGSNSAGSIEFINSGAVNAGSLAAEGIDVTFTDRVPLGNVFGMEGSIDARVTYSHIFNNYVVPLPGADKDVSGGEIGTAADRFNAYAGFRSEQFDWGFTGTFIGSSCEDDQSLISYDLQPCDIKVGAEFYLDSQMRFRASDIAEFYIGVDNLLDNSAPKILSGGPFNTTGADTAADVYDIFGRRYYAGFRLRL